MESSENQITEPQNKLELSKIAINHLKETRKWANFLAILGFISIGFMVIVGLFAGAMMSMFYDDTLGVPFPSAGFTIIYFVMGLIYFFPTLYLYRFSTWIRKALLSSESGDLSQAFSNLRSLYRYLGILSIIGLAIYLLFFIYFMVLGGMSSGFMT